jgi:hypothetical protein
MMAASYQCERAVGPNSEGRRAIVWSRVSRLSWGLRLLATTRSLPFSTKQATALKPPV